MAKDTTRKSSASAVGGTATAVLESPPEPQIVPKSVPESASTITTAPSEPPARKRRPRPLAAQFNRFPAVQTEDELSNRQAELFYLQKQIQQQTQMVLILEDGERVQGIIEWYDRHSIKVRGKNRVLVYKAAIKYLYKAGEIGTAPEK